MTGRIEAERGGSTAKKLMPAVTAFMAAGLTMVLIVRHTAPTPLVGPLALHDWMLIFLILALAGFSWHLRNSLRLGIAARSGSEAALLKSEERYRELFENAKDIIYTHDLEGNITSVNKAAELLTGFSREQLLTMNIFRMISEKDVPRIRQMFEEGLKRADHLGVEHEEIEITGSQGRSFSVEINARLIYEDGTRVGVQGIARDITERSLNEDMKNKLHAALENAAAEWRLTFDSVESPILVMDLEGRLRRMNRAARDLTCRNYSENLGKSVSRIAAGEPWQKSAAIVEEIKRSRSPISCQVRDGDSRRTWDIAASLYSSPAGGDDRVILVAHDITRMTELQESLHKSETMAAMGSLVAGVAHEVRNPLFSISATLDAFEARFGQTGGHERYTVVLRRELNRMSNLMRDLLEYGKPPRLEISDESVRDLLAQATASCAALADKSGVEVSSRISDDIGNASVDGRRIVQVFYNLIDNAIRFSPRGSRVEIEARRTELNGAPVIECTVRDTGPGFQGDDLGRIFEPFFTRRRGGTGLGLAIVQRIVDEHRGMVSAANRLEGGAAITVILPVGNN